MATWATMVSSLLAVRFDYLLNQIDIAAEVDRKQRVICALFLRSDVAAFRQAFMKWQQTQTTNLLDNLNALVDLAKAGRSLPFDW